MRTHNLLVGTIGVWITVQGIGYARDASTAVTRHSITEGNSADVSHPNDSIAHPNDSTGPPQIPAAFTSFEVWAERYVNNSANARTTSSILQGLGLVRQRRVEFAQLMKSDPKSALAHAIPTLIRERLPLEITQELETPVAGIGDLMAFCAMPSVDQTAAGVGGLYWKVRLNGRFYRAFIHGSQLSGSSRFQIPLQGLTLDGMIALDESTISRSDPGVLRPDWDTNFAQPLIGTGPTTTTASVLVVRVDFSDMPGDPYWLAARQIYTAPAVQAIADGEVAPYYQNSSYSNLTINFTVTPKVYRLPSTAAYYAVHGYEFTLYFDALAAAQSDYESTNYDKVIVLCSWLGSIPGSELIFAGITLVGSSITLINGQFTFRVVAHELGHIFGLYHADFWYSSTQDPVDTAGASLDYSDPFDPMSANWNNDYRVDFNPWFKSQLGWFHDGQVQTVTSNGVYRVYRFDDAAATGTLALKVAKDSTRDYWIGFRRNFTDNPSLQNGAYVVWGYHQPQPSDLLGLGPTVNTLTDPGLRVGSTLVDRGTHLTITPFAHGGESPHEYLDLEITFGPTPPPLHASLVYGRLVLSWPATGDDFTLEACTGPFDSKIWVPVTHQPVAQDGNFAFTNFVQSPAGFFRLHYRH